MTSNSTVLSSIDSLVRISFSDVDSFSTTEAFVATWENVVPYTEGTLGVSFVTIDISCMHTEAKNVRIHCTCLDSRVMHTS